MFSEIITIGDEILIGQIIDSNSAWMAESLNAIGIQIRQISSISDQQEEIIRALNEASQRVPLVFLTGGLGPTRDDITIKALAKYFDSELKINQEALERVEKFLGSRGVKMNELNRQQAMLPGNCDLIANRFGSASGMWFKKDDRHFISMPGVPYEMKGMMTGHILPELRKMFSLPVVEHKNILTQGCPESQLAKKLEPFEDQLDQDIKLAYLPSPGQVRLRLSTIGTDKTEIRDRLDEAAEKIKKIIPEYVAAFEDEKLEVIVGKLLAEQNASLATAESCTGGRIAELIVSVPGASAYFKGAVVAYANEIKTKILGVDEDIIVKQGAVSKDVIVLMAKNIRKMFGADYSIATSGVAGPTGGTDDKPVGTTWIAVASEKNVISEKFNFGDVRERNIQKSTITALNMLRKLIQSEIC